MNYKIHPNDIPVLAKIFQPDTSNIFVLTTLETLPYYQNIPDKLDCTIQFFTNEQDLIQKWHPLDTKEKSLINLTSRALSSNFLSIESTSIIIDFSAKQLIDSSTNHYQFDFINNPDGTIRWVYNNLLQKPIFLNLYNASGWKGKAIHTIFKIGFIAKLKKWLKSGSFKVIANQLFLENVNHRLNEAQYAIFTGTIGENRKAVISFEEAGKATKFLKLPLTKAAQQLVRTETKVLTKLQTYTFRFLNIPKAKKITKGLMLTNIKPSKLLINNDLTTIHLSALAELYHQTAAPVLLTSSDVWQTIQEDLEVIVNTKIINDLPPQKVADLHRSLAGLAQNFESTDLITMSMTHGDLTPWNSYLSKHQLHVYDWELAQELPLLYDAFHYIFQANILIKRLPYAAIKKEISQLRNHPIIQSLLTKYNIDFQEAYQFYLLRNTSYYLSKYIQQPKLHEQAHWLVDVWIESLNSECVFEID